MAVEKERMRQLKRHQASLSTRDLAVLDLCTAFGACAKATQKSVVHGNPLKEWVGKDPNRCDSNLQPSHSHGGRPQNFEVFFFTLATVACRNYVHATATLAHWSHYC